MSQGILNTQRMYSGSNFEPHPLRASVFSKATMPAQRIKTKNPDHILINQSGSYSFNYSSTAVLGAAVTGTYISASVIESTTGLPVRLDISPCAWESKNATTGDVTFVYRGN